MTRKKILGSHVKRLLSGVSVHGRRHLNEVETDLLQTELLLEEAIDKLTGSFMAIHSAVGSRQETINRLLAGDTPSPEDSEKLSAMSGEIGQHVNSAITSMQFQDMTSQLLDRTLKRVAGLRDFLGTLSEHGADIAPETDSEEIVERLGKVSMALAIQSLELRSMLRKSVEQRHLESGDIELF
ncbi:MULTISPECIES: chemotaxis protein [unclassified Massilia]|uniref:chemotaxis protein n=1 Tax=unclassified Massilia TaxID=2609279 RepID=UPI001B844235|nr:MULTISPECIES: chemotaxis protein [unclassified Massilia]MBQ5941618.1 chemotaxis protein [Massilia sp. AB1]MBQ5962518.1 chemotaxis protein [Massilia sp. ZL223]